MILIYDQSQSLLLVGQLANAQMSRMMNHRHSPCLVVGVVFLKIYIIQMMILAIFHYRGDIQFSDPKYHSMIPNSKAASLPFNLHTPNCLYYPNEETLLYLCGGRTLL